MIGIIGAICGDAIGSSYEFNSTTNYDFQLFTDRTHVTDDTTCTIAIAKWLLSGNLTQENLLQTLVNYCKSRPYGFGPMFWEWIEGEEHKPYGSYGNGSAMRVSPVAWYARTYEECIRLATISAMITHNSTEGIKGAQAIATAIFLTKIGKSKDEVIEHIHRNFEYNIPIFKDIKRNHFKCTCKWSVPVSLACWYESTSYEDCIRKAISLGGDADTEACIAGSICNANPNTQVDDELVLQVLEKSDLIDNDMIDTINEFHERFE